MESGNILYKGDPLIQALWFGVYLVNILLIAVRWKRFICVATKDKLLLALLVIALVSILWSTAPIYTLRRSLGLAGTTVFGIYLAMRYNLQEQLRLLAWALGIAALLSLLFAVVLPHYGIESKIHEGAWRGLYHQKNVLGRYMSLGGPVFLLIALSCRRYRWVAWFGFGLSAGLLLLSTSKNALVSFLTVLLVLPFYRALRWTNTLKVPFFIAIVLLSGSIAILLLGNTEILLNAMGKDLTFSGRTQLWDFLFEKIQERPWLGYGYGGFWLGWEGESADIWSIFTWHPRHAHNGFLQLWLDLGLLGLLAFVLSFLSVCLKAAARTKITTTTEALWPLAYLTLMFLSNLAESVILAQNNIFWILYVATLLSMALQCTQAKNTSRIGTTLTKGGWV
ncbi:ligase [Chroococcidiopsis cubana SAG 39.79]|uniref:Ligase n=1 Tax=Chroococcidiopsis cubana SAG 39.79 TaxID=388085 RepID=A0AB37UBB1_9CYAN|nr:ligase [Chroococcidiopsis cubana SAG 39.79]